MSRRANAQGTSGKPAVKDFCPRLKKGSEISVNRYDESDAARPRSRRRESTASAPLPNPPPSSRIAPPSAGSAASHAMAPIALLIA
jgi:hypothetical protein